MPTTNSHKGSAIPVRPTPQMEFNSLLSKSAQKRIAEGESPADAVKPVVQPTQTTPEDDAAFDVRLTELTKTDVPIKELSKLSDVALESWLR